MSCEVALTVEYAWNWISQLFTGPVSPNCDGARLHRHRTGRSTSRPGLSVAAHRRSQDSPRCLPEPRTLIGGDTVAKVQDMEAQPVAALTRRVGMQEVTPNSQRTSSLRLDLQQIMLVQGLEESQHRDSPDRRSVAEEVLVPVVTTDSGRLFSTGCLAPAGRRHETISVSSSSEDAHGRHDG